MILDNAVIQPANLEITYSPSFCLYKLQRKTSMNKTMVYMNNQYLMVVRVTHIFPNQLVCLINYYCMSMKMVYLQKYVGVKL